MSKTVIFSTENYSYLLNELLEFGFEKGKKEIKFFPDGERYQRVLTNIEHKDVIIVGGTISDSDTLELYDLACAISKYGANHLILVIPYFGYSTMERAIKTGEIVTAKTRARLLSAVPQAKSGNHIILLDLHSEGIPHYFEGEVTSTHLYAKEVIIQATKEICNNNDFILACTDAGRAKWVESLANDIGVSAAFVLKRRVSGSDTKITSINADVKDKHVIIYDDMIRTGSSLIEAAKAYKNAGASKISAITTHPIFPNDSLKKIEETELFDVIYCTNSHPKGVELQSKFLKTLSIANIIGKKLLELL
ncbi:ribose-phosphate pyrophosphokinase [bacterium]|nr:ribose-phosphate pyrophosphokinase [bacterium]